MEKIKVFCLPYAGGSKNIYYDWKEKYSDVAEIVPIEYSGHGSRFGEELFLDAEDMAQDGASIIKKEKPTNYIIYGHSMGSLIALLVAMELEATYNVAPKLVVVSGLRPPHLRYKDEKLAGLSKQELMQKICDLGQMSEEVMNEPELVDLIYDIIYADIRAEEGFEPREHMLLKTSLVVTTGSMDHEAPEEDMLEWKNYTEGTFECKTFSGGHFFPFENEEFHSYFKQIIREA